MHKASQSISREPLDSKMRLIGTPPYRHILRVIWSAERRQNVSLSFPLRLAGVPQIAAIAFSANDIVVVGQIWSCSVTVYVLVLLRVLDKTKGSTKPHNVLLA